MRSGARRPDRRAKGVAADADAIARPLVLGLSVLLLAASLACGLGGDVEPLKPRDDYFEGGALLPDLYKGMDLPWHGGVIQKGSDRLLLVSYYSDPRPTPEQLKAWWPEALAAEGWVETSRNLSGNGALDVGYDLPDGSGAFVTIAPEGTTWKVTITLNPAPEASP